MPEIFSQFTVSAQSNFLTRTAPSSFDLPYQLCWSYPTEQLNAEQIASDNVSSIYVSNMRGGVTAVNVSDGEKLWQTELGGNIISNLQADKEAKNIYVITKKMSFDISEEKNNGDKKISGDAAPSDSLKLWALSRTAGLTNWHINIDGGVSDTSRASDMSSANDRAYLFLNGQNLILSLSSGKLLSVNKISGSVNWMTTTGSSSAVAPSFSDNSIYTATGANSISEISTSNGRTIRKIQSVSSYNLIYVRDRKEILLILGDKKGEVSAKNIGTGKRVWKLRTGGEISSIVDSPQGVLVTSYDNFIYLVSPSDGRIIWKKRMEGRTAGNPLVISNLVVVTTVGTSQASILELSDGKLFNTISLTGENYFSGPAHYLNGVIIFPTLKGIFGFGHETNPCS